MKNRQFISGAEPREKEERNGRKESEENGEKGCKKSSAEKEGKKEGF